MYIVVEVNTKVILGWKAGDTRMSLQVFMSGDCCLSFAFAERVADFVYAFYFWFEFSIVGWNLCEFICVEHLI